MTREELKEHCKRQVQQFERVAKIMPVTPNDWKRYEEHKLILELLEQETVSKESYDHEYFLRKEFELKIDKLQRQLDKIRAEIEKWHKEGTNWSNIRLIEIEIILDKEQDRK